MLQCGCIERTAMHCSVYAQLEGLYLVAPASLLRGSSSDAAPVRGCVAPATPALSLLLLLLPLPLLLVQVDCYALGCLLLECVTGERPWKGCNMVQVAYQVRRAVLWLAICGTYMHCIHQHVMAARRGASADLLQGLEFCHANSTSKQGPLTSGLHVMPPLPLRLHHRWPWRTTGRRCLPWTPTTARWSWCS